MPKPSTKATAKYQAKVGLVAKTYKLKADVAEAFKNACKISGESQAAALTQFMVEYVEKSGKATVASPKALEGQLEVGDCPAAAQPEPVKCARCGTVHQDGYDENEYFRCEDCEFGNYRPSDDEDDEYEDDNEIVITIEHSDDIVLAKWEAQLKKASKKAGLPCVYQYRYGREEPHIFVNNEKIYIPQDETGALIRLGVVHENVPKK